MKKKNVLYVIYLDKFTEALVDFFTNKMSHLNNKFIIYGRNQQFKFEADGNKIVFLDSYKKMNKNIPAYMWARNADAIIFSGIFGGEKFLIKFPEGTLEKSYFQFWGGDFYDLRDNIPVYKVKQWLSRAIKIHYIKNVKGIINLIPGDYNELQKLVRTNAEHFIAPVCGNDKDVEFYTNLFSMKKSGDPIKICLGNSATRTNNHKEALKILRKYKNENIRIICPLSYGDKDYANEIIAYGKQIFGEKFEALTDYMSKESYFTMLSDCKIGIFNHDRQQGMGNINALVTMGAKLYMKANTSMWKTYTEERGYRIFDIKQIPEMDFDEFIRFDENTATSNYNQAKYYNSGEYKKTQWNTFFNAIFRS